MRNVIITEAVLLSVTAACIIVGSMKAQPNNVYVFKGEKYAIWMETNVGSVTLKLDLIQDEKIVKPKGYFNGINELTLTREREAHLYESK